jgi:large subunit ribosomal protein L15
VSDELGLHELRPAEGSHRGRKRVGRGKGSGYGKTSGRGQKGQKSRSGSHRLRAGFEGGQMPTYMRLGKLRGPNHKKSMPMGPFRTQTVPVNLRDLERFDAGVEVTPELLRAAGVVRNRKHPIKVLAKGELTKALVVHAHGFSARAAEAIEAAGGRVVRLGEGGEVVPEGEVEHVPDTFVASPPNPPEATAESETAGAADEEDDEDAGA